MTGIQNIVIVGAGNGGLSVFNGLSPVLDAKKYNIILINNRSFFIHRPAGLRMAVTSEGKLEDRILVPLDDARFNTGNKKLIVGEVVSIVDDDSKGHYVVLTNGDQVEFSVLVLAPGSIWEGPLEYANVKSDIVPSVETWRNRFRDARDIVIVGGGAIGTELAGEIKDLTGERNVTLVHAQTLPFNNTYPDRWRDRVASDLRVRGVELALGEFVDDFTIKDGYITTRNNTRIKADLVVTTRGPKPNTKFVESLGSDVLATTGYVKVTPTLQMPGHERILVLGDAIDWNEQKQSAKIRGHASVVNNNVLFLLGLKKRLIPYKGSYELIVLTNGKRRGSSYFGILWGIILGNWLSTKLKSDGLLIDMTMQMMGLA